MSAEHGCRHNAIELSVIANQEAHRIDLKWLSNKSDGNSRLRPGGNAKVFTYYY